MARSSKLQSLEGQLLVIAPDRWHRPHDTVVSIQALRSLAPGPLDLGCTDVRQDRSDDGFGQPVLEIEDVLDLAVVAICPDVPPVRAIDQVSSDTEASTGLPNTSQEHVPDTQAPARPGARPCRCP